MLPYFAVFMALWSAMVLKHWQRTEKTTSMEWGMVGCEEEETVRPQFRGDKKISAVTGKVVFVPAFYDSFILHAILIVVRLICCC